MWIALRQIQHTNFQGLAQFYIHIPEIQWGPKAQIIFMQSNKGIRHIDILLFRWYAGGASWLHRNAKRNAMWRTQIFLPHRDLAITSLIIAQYIISIYILYLHTVVLNQIIIGWKIRKKMNECHESRHWKLIETTYIKILSAPLWQILRLPDFIFYFLVIGNLKQYLW